MIININFNESYRRVNKTRSGFATGSCFVGDKYINQECLLDDLSDISNTKQLEYKLGQYNGFYAFIINKGNELFAAVDRIRSIPLFYGKQSDNFYISNDAEWVRENCSTKEMDEIARDEFLLTGYVTGQDTLCDQVKQLQAGEYLYINADREEIMPVRYYRFLHKEPDPIAGQDKYQGELDSAMNKIIERLIVYASGRQIVIPLSGGRDSRLIVLKLKQLGYKNVCCFTYGMNGNLESEISKKVAAALGFSWEFVEYTKNLWEKWWASSEMEKYRDMACNLTSLPLIQDWPAVWELRNRRCINTDAVIAPGLSGDFPAGSHIPPVILPYAKASKKDFLYFLKKKYYSLLLYPYGQLQTKVWKDRILSCAEIIEISNGIECVDALEKWNWQERQAKFIVNSIRAYEFWGYDWWLPFWEYEFMEYWQNIPLKYRKGKVLYDNYVDLVYKRIVGESWSNGLEKRKTNNRGLIIKLFLKKIHCYEFVTDFVHYIVRYIKKKQGQTFNSVHGFLGAFSTEFVKNNKKGVNNLNGFIAIYTIYEINEKFKLIQL